MKKILAFTFAAICLICTSCNDYEMDYNNSTWYGVTGNGYVYLQFSDGVNLCTVKTGSKEISFANGKTFEARWTGKYTFDLYPVDAEQVVKQFSGTIERNRMTFSYIEGGSTKTTYDLSRIELVQE
ncbi:MAG: hypothetical protein IKX60_03635 [Bacteroidales bacterium]|nr:hypothetical protein [Bacteroidales bacterium]